MVILAKLLGKKVVVFYRGWKLGTYNRLHKKAVYRKLFNLVFQRNTLQVVLASAFKQDLMNLKPKKSNEILVTTTAIDKTQIVKPNKNLSPTPIKVLFLGRIQDLKGIEELIEAIITLKNKEQISVFQFSVVGHENKTGYIDELKAKLQANGIVSDKVTFLGRITGKDKFQLYANHQIYVLPSYTEGCPNSLLEALASGMFCITTRVGALSDVIIPKENGMFVNVKDSAAIFKALMYCSSNVDFNKNRSAHAKKYSEKFDIKKITQLFETKYIDLIENK